MKVLYKHSICPFFFLDITQELSPVKAGVHPLGSLLWSAICQLIERQEIIVQRLYNFQYGRFLPLCQAEGARLKWMKGEAEGAHDPGPRPSARGLTGDGGRSGQQGITKGPTTYSSRPPCTLPAYWTAHLMNAVLKASLRLHLNRDFYLFLLTLNFVSWWGEEESCPVSEFLPSVHYPSLDEGATSVLPAEAGAPLPWRLEKRRRQDEGSGASLISPR